ncbi:general stress protein [Jidongwangia harbinensis]|uniref:general stress protein n=1 Tax=Jidongwangia harbinensis TaxID=2878561 RepID=UPI001CD9C315|nr:general stress protein [Jidongwangia harbinensis]
MILRTDRTDDHVYRLGEFMSYRDAERVVDRLSDVGFPVERVRIVGTGLHSVEQVMGRLTKTRSTLLGAALGAWLGMLTGLLLGLFVAGAAWPAMTLGGLLIGAAAGAVVGFVNHWATDGRRDFASTTAMHAQKYAVEVDSAHAVEAVRALDRN